jgi:hypothetical protein
MWLTLWAFVRLCTSIMHPYTVPLHTMILGILDEVMFWR